MKKERIVSTRSNQDIEKMLNNFTKGKTIAIKNWTEKRDFDAQNSTLGDLANSFATLVNELKSRGIL